MKIKADALMSLQVLECVAQGEYKHLQIIDQRVFDESFADTCVRQLTTDSEFSRRVKASAARFCRPRGPLCDKLIPVLPRALGESVGTTIDNLDRAERLGWLVPADEFSSTWLLCKQAIHDHIEGSGILGSSLSSAHARVSRPLAACSAPRAMVGRRRCSDEAVQPTCT